MRRQTRDIRATERSDDHAFGAVSVAVARTPDTGTLAAWDDVVRRTPDSDVAQLSAWADVRRAAGFEPLYVLARRGEELVGGALVVTRRLPLVGAVGYVPYGPLIAPDADRREVVPALATVLSRVARRPLRMLFVQPAQGDDDVSAELRHSGFRPSEAGIAPGASLRLDLGRDLDDLRAGLRKRLQRWTRTWPKHGVAVRHGTSEDVALLARFHAETARHQGFEPIPGDYLQTLYDRLAAEGCAELFVAEVDGRPVAARLFTGCGGVLKDRFAGMDRSTEAAKLSTPAAIYWTAICWAKANGYRGFDLGGVTEEAVRALEDDPTDSSGLTGSEVFKASFGAVPFRYPTPVELISSPPVRMAYELSQRWPATRRLVNRATHLLRASRRTSR